MLAITNPAAKSVSCLRGDDSQFSILTHMQQLTGLIGIGVILAIGFALSTNRRRINVRTIVSGVAIQLLLAFLFLRFPPVVRVFDFSLLA